MSILFDVIGRAGSANFRPTLCESLVEVSERPPLGFHETRIMIENVSVTSTYAVCFLLGSIRRVVE